VGFDFMGGRRRGHRQDIDYFVFVVVSRIMRFCVAPRWRMSGE
jgi:hypothetical protein